MRLSLRARTIISALKDFFSRNKKVIICSLIIFLIGLIVGCISLVRSVSDGFERIVRADMQIGGAKVFFISLLALLGAYACFLIAGINNKTVFVALLPFFALGVVCGQYATALVAKYETFGILNLLLSYMPFFIGTLCCFLLCASVVCAPSCSCSSSGLKPSFISTLKIFGINVLISLILFLVIGSIFGVIVVELY